MRLVKLVRLLRGARMFKRWEARLAINYSTLTLALCLIGVLISSHWFACVWALQARRQHALEMPFPLGGGAAARHHHSLKEGRLLPPGCSSFSGEAMEPPSLLSRAKTRQQHAQ